jgi:quinol monooxygenase YgiN
VKDLGPGNDGSGWQGTVEAGAKYEFMENVATDNRFDTGDRRMYVVAARFVAKDGSGDEVAALLAEMTPHAKAEPGCKAYAINRSVDDPNTFLLYEQYVDAAAFDAHRENSEFQRIIIGEVVPLLAERGREIFELVAD